MLIMFLCIEALVWRPFIRRMQRYISFCSYGSLRLLYYRPNYFLTIKQPHEGWHCCNECRIELPKSFPVEPTQSSIYVHLFITIYPFPTLSPFFHAADSTFFLAFKFFKAYCSKQYEKWESLKVQIHCHWN